MKRKIWISREWVFLIVSLILICTVTDFAQAQSWSLVPSADSSQNSDNYKPGELLVRFVNGQNQILASVGSAVDGQQLIGPRTTISIRSAVASSIVGGASVVKEYDRGVPGLSLVKLPAGVTVLDAIVSFNRSSYVLYAQPNYIIKATVTPNDPMFSQQWGLNNIGQTGGLPDADIDAPEAWDIETENPNIIVAVLDTGIDYTHPDLADNMFINPGEVNEPGVVDPDNDFNNVDDDGNTYIDDIYGYDFVDDDSDPMDENFHGTHVAGIIGAIGNNGTGIAGVCWSVKLMAVRILDADGLGTSADAIEGITYALSWQVDVMNASWGGYGYDLAL
jgi:subtilisin family serine protease